MANCTITIDQRGVEGRALALSFANTLEWRIGRELEESLASYGDLLAWSVENGIVDVDSQAYLVEQADIHPKVAALVLQRALVLREAIARIFANTSRGQSCATSDLALVNSELASAMGGMTLVATDEGVALVCSQEAQHLDGMLRPIALSAAELLTSTELSRVRQCADDEGNGCGYFFIDKSRNGTRRWCSMESCGNRAKAKRHYARATAESK